MKCEICGYEFVVGDIIHERPGEIGYIGIISCDICYNTYMED